MGGRGVDIYRSRAIHNLTVRSIPILSVEPRLTLIAGSTIILSQIHKVDILQHPSRRPGPYSRSRLFNRSSHIIHPTRPTSPTRALSTLPHNHRLSPMISPQSMRMMKPHHARIRPSILSSPRPALFLPIYWTQSQPRSSAPFSQRREGRVKSDSLLGVDD